MDIFTLLVTVFTEASFAKTLDLYSQLGYLILLPDEQGNATSIH